MPHLTVDHHRADTADLFETRHVPDRRSGLLALDRHRIFADVHQRRDDIKITAVRDLKRLPVSRRAFLFTPLDLKFDRRGRVVEAFLFDVCRGTHAL